MVSSYSLVKNSIYAQSERTAEASLALKRDATEKVVVPPMPMVASRMPVDAMVTGVTGVANDITLRS